MKRLMISGLAVTAVLAGAAVLLRSHPTAAQIANLPTSTISLRELHGATNVNKLPTEEFEDLSLVYTTAVTAR